MSDIDMGAIANRLYGGASTPATPAATETPAAATEPVVKPEDTAVKQAALREGIAQQNRDIERAKVPMEQRMWGDKPDVPKPDVPDAIAELRNTPERRLYFADTFKTAVNTELAISKATTPTTVKERAGVDMTVEQIAEAAPAVAAELHAVYQDCGLTDREAVLVEDTIVDLLSRSPDPAADAANANASIAVLNERYGMGAAQALRDAQAFIARDPRLGKIMEMSRGGNDPRLVLLAAEAAQRARSRGEKF